MTDSLGVLLAPRHREALPKRPGGGVLSFLKVGGLLDLFSQEITIGAGTSAKVGFDGATPTAQRAGPNQGAATYASQTTGGCPYGRRYAWWTDRWPLSGS